jgi:molybdopterin converting factor small subunit
MRVFIPPPLRSYTGGRAHVELEGATLGAVLDALDARYPGLRFRIVDEQDRIRPHIRFIVREEFAHALDRPLDPGDEVQIVCALSGGLPDPYCAVRKVGDTSPGTAQSGGESEEGRRPAPLGRVRGEGRGLAVCPASPRAFPANEAERAIV